MSEKSVLAAGLANQLASSLATIDQRLMGIEKSGAEHAESLKELEKKLFLGNGSPGILPEMDKRIDRIEQVQARRSNRDIALWGAIALIIAAMIGAWWQVNREKAEARSTRSTPAIQQDSE
jgi:hypothetical protein